MDRPLAICGLVSHFTDFDLQANGISDFTCNGYSGRESSSDIVYDILLCTKLPLDCETVTDLISQNNRNALNSNQSSVKTVRINFTTLSWHVYTSNPRSYFAQLTQSVDVR